MSEAEHRTGEDLDREIWDAAMGQDQRRQAIDDVDRLCSDFLVLARQLKNVQDEYALALRDAELREINDHVPVSQDQELRRIAVSKERLTMAAMAAADAVHAAQRRWALMGVDVYVSHTRNGSPIRVDRTTRNSIIG